METEIVTDVQDVASRDVLPRRPLMNRWLRLLLITMSVGGGFTGVSVAVDAMSKSHADVGIGAAFLLASTFVLVSGLAFVLERKTTLLFAAIAVQVPTLSTPLVIYQFWSGFHVTFTAGNLQSGSSGVDFHAGLGSFFKFYLAQGDGWNFGVNLFALVLLILLFRPVSHSRSTSEPIDVTE
jgi:hypothetical protein